MQNTNRELVILIAAYNEERHIAETIHQIFKSSIESKIAKVIVAEDGSSDQTRAILEGLKNNYDRLIFETYGREGKPRVLNHLIEKYHLNQENYTLVFMDANIVLDSNCLEYLMEKLSFRNVSMVGASVIPLNMERNVESQYILRENSIKLEESRTMGCVIGVFGACYTMLGEDYRPVPANFITDDLYQTLDLARRGRIILYSTEAKVYEAITAQVENEFRRKSRYAAGNFQILIHFKDLLWPGNVSIGFIYCYFFHKIIRWLSPVLFFIFWGLSFFRLFGECSNIIMIGGIGICLFLWLNYVWSKSDKSPIGYRFYYFLSMNLAILYGFFKYIKGVKSNVWERSERK